MQFKKFCRTQTESSKNKTLGENVNATVETGRKLLIDVEEAATSTAAAATTTACSMAKSFQKVSTVNQTYRVRRKSSEMVRLDWFFHRHSTQVRHDKCRKDDPYANGGGRTRKESDPWKWIQRRFLRNRNGKTQKKFWKAN